MKCFFNLKDEARSAQMVGAVSRLWGAEVLPMNDLSLWHFNRNGKRTEALGQKSVKGVQKGEQKMTHQYSLH